MSAPTQSQSGAIASDAPVTVIAAGPGSGKTKTLVGRVISQLFAGVEPRKIIVLTFTNAAARELQTERSGGCLGVQSSIAAFHFESTSTSVRGVHLSPLRLGSTVLATFMGVCCSHV